MDERIEDMAPVEGLPNDTARVRLLSSVSADLHAVAGSGMGGGGGGKGGGSSSARSDAGNTLRSNAKARIVEVLGEGEIVGLVDGARSIVFDATPLQNSDGSYNFTGVTWQDRVGQPEQAALVGMAQTETTYSVNVEVKHAQEPPIRTIADVNATSVRIVITLPSLFIQDQKSGSLQTTGQHYMIDRRANGGQWEEVTGEVLLNQKCTSPVQRQLMMALPEGGHPYSIRVRKIPLDSNVEWHQNAVVWESYTSIVEAKLTYPNTALVALELDAANFGNSIPTRYFDVKGLIIQVPSNYDPESRAYNGFWDGSFKRAWTNNPAWIFYDLITNNRYGLGEVIDASKVDKFGLYEIAQWCDQPVDDGKGGKEPRYTFNGVINTRDEAFKVLQQITTSFSGMAFWSVGQVFAVADMPADPIKLMTPANVIGGQFKYSRTAKKTRNTVAMVSWNDPEDFYRTAIEVVQHEDGLDKFGWRQTEIQAIGCTSRGLANRIGRWRLDTEHTATETVEFEMGLEALAHDPLRPGHIISIADPRKAQVRLGGRIVGQGGNRLLLDRPFTPLAGSSYRISVVTADGSIAASDVTGWADGNQTVSTREALPPVVAGAMWSISGTDVNPRQYRVLAVSEPKKNTFKIQALFHDPQKYARVEEGIILDPIHYTRPRSTIKPPTNLKIVERQVFRDGLPKTELLLSWTPGDDWLSGSYSVYVAGDGGESDQGSTPVTSMTLSDLAAGNWTAYVTAVGFNGGRSQPAQIDFTVRGWEGTAGPTIANLRSRSGADGQFSGKDCTLDWDVSWPEGTIPYAIDFVVRVFDAESRTLLSEWVEPTQSFTYYFDDNVADGGPRRKFWVQVRARDVLLREGAPASLVCSNPAPEMIVPTLETTTESVFLSYDPPADPDWYGGLVWMEREQGFEPLATKPAYDGLSTLVNLKAIPETYYYVRFAAYDQFGKTGLNISPELRVYVTNKIIDVNAPEIPTGLVLATESETAADGTVTALIRATWDENPSPNFGLHEVEIREKPEDETPPAAWSRDRVTDPLWEKHGLLTGRTYQVRVRAANTSDFVSGWCEPVEILTAQNENPPGPVTELAVTATFQTGIVTWVDPAERDLEVVEIWSGTSATTAEKDRVLLGRSGRGVQMFYDKTLSTDGERFYWARTLNTSGVYGLEFTGPVQAVSPVIRKEELAASIIDQTSFADGLTAIGTTDGLPAVAGYDGPLVIINKQDGKLYQLKDGKWILVVSEVKVEDIVGQITDDMLKEIDAAKVAGQLTNAQIQDLAANKLIGQIVSDQIEALGVNKLIGQLKDTQIEALSAAKVVGQLVDAQIAAVGAGKLTGQIKGTQIADDSITTPKVVAGSINADRLIVESITSAQIKTRTIVASDIAVGTLTANELGANSVTATQIAANSVNAYAIVAGSITTDKIAARQINAGHIVVNSLTGDVIAANTITGTNISGRTITGAHIVANTLTAGEIAAKTIVAWNIAAGTITGAEIKAGSVDADRLTANSITAGQIAAGAIKAEAISAGAITTDKLGVGLSSGNFLFNSDFQDNINGWTASWYSDGVAPQISMRTDYAPKGMGTACVYRPGNPSNGVIADFVLGRRAKTAWEIAYPVTPGQRYEFTAYVSVHRCRAQTLLVWLDSTGAQIGVTYSAELPSNGVNGPLESRPRAGVFGFAPEGAVQVRPVCRTTYTGESEPYTFWTGLYFGKATRNQSEFSSWVPNSSTVIDGGTIATNSLSAASIVAGTITADKIAGTTITGDKIAVNTITGTNILANSIYADRIQIGGGQSLTNWLGGPNNTQLSGGAIAANSINANSLKIGARGLAMTGIEFSADKNTNLLSWTAGTIVWVDDNGNAQASNIAAGSVGWGGWIGVYWFKGRTYLDYANDRNGGWNAHIANPDAVPMCFYSGWTGLNVLKGGSTIDGTRINTGTIQANQIAAGQIQAQHIASDTIKAGMISAGAVTADKLNGGTITASSAINVGSGRFTLDVPNRMMRIYTPQGTEAVSIGNIGRFYGQGDDGEHGIIVRGPGNAEVMRVDGGQAYIEAAYIRNLRVTNAQIADAQITNAKIGNLEVDYIKINKGSITQTVAASSGGQDAALVLYSRSGASRFQINAYRRGAAGRQFSAFSDPGNLYIDYSFDGSNWGVVDGIPNVTSYQYDAGVRASWQILHCTALPTAFSPGWEGNIWFRVRDTNNVGVGGVYISVSELAL